MKRNGLIVLLLLAASGICLAGAVPFAENGTLKMLYDNRMYPQAVEDRGHIYIVWRGAKGLPYIITYSLSTHTFSDPVMVLDGLSITIDARKYEIDHHYAPVIWIDSGGYLHLLFGCHGNSGGIHLVSRKPQSINEWAEDSSIYSSISYPQVHAIHQTGSLVYFRDRGHLGSWTYRTSFDSGKNWGGPPEPVIDLNRAPQTGRLAEHAGSYNTTRVSRDGRKLHVAFIWKLEEPVPNRRYQKFLGDHTQRYNLYYLYVDLLSGSLFNRQGRQLEAPVDKLTADNECLVWDTDERVVSVGPSIFLDEEGQPCFLLPVSEETPFRCRYYFVKYEDGSWRKRAITRTPHPFNSSLLTQQYDKTLLAYLIAGDGESVPGPNMDRYGWGDRVELWTSSDRGSTWTLHSNLTPRSGLKYQNVQFILGEDGQPDPERILFYAWDDQNGPGTAFLYVTSLAP